MNIQEIKAIIQGVEDGKMIQLLEGKWKDINMPQISGGIDIDYNEFICELIGDHRKLRVKPEPREWLVTVCDDNNERLCRCNPAESCKKSHSIMVREVFDDE